VTPLKDLSQLQLLYLDANKLTGLTPLKDLTQLTELRLSDNPSLSKVQIDELQKALPKCNILHDAKK
jgi:Leucine-rich repeat (LRR) protein